MRGVIISALVLVAAACTASRKPPEVAPNDPNAIDPSDSTSTKSHGSDDADDAKPAKGSTPPPEDTPPAKETKASSDSPHVPATLGGSRYDRATLEVTLARAARQVKSNCGGATDENGVVTGPWGKATFTVKLGHNGHSKGGTIGGGFAGKPPGNCVEKAFTNLIYAPFAGDDVDVDWPVEIVKP
jgi:hypothetical protein